MTTVGIDELAIPMRKYCRLVKLRLKNVIDENDVKCSEKKVLVPNVDRGGRFY